MYGTKLDLIDLTAPQKALYFDGFPYFYHKKKT